MLLVHKGIRFYHFDIAVISLDLSGSASGYYQDTLCKSVVKDQQYIRDSQLQLEEHNKNFLLNATREKYLTALSQWVISRVRGVSGFCDIAIMYIIYVYVNMFCIFNENLHAKYL